MIPCIEISSEETKTGVETKIAAETRKIPFRFWFCSRYMPYLFCALFTIALLWPLCIGRTLYWGDILLYFDPMNRFARHELLLGRLPFWNPYILCGQPFIGNPQMSVFYPTTLLLVLFPAWLALNLTTLLNLFLCGIFAYYFIRRWTVLMLPALAGAAVFMGGACLMGRLQFPPLVQTAAYFPLLLAVIDRNIDRPSWKTWLAFSAAIALMILAAHTQTAYLALTCGLAYATMRLWRQSVLAIPTDERRRLRRHKRWQTFRVDLASFLRRCVPFLAASGLGVMLTSIYLIPAFQLLHESPRDQMSIGQANRFFSDAPHLLTLLFPRFVGHPATRDFWGRGNAWEPAWFIGWIPLLLIGYAIARCSKEKLVRFWAAVVLIGTWLSLGSGGGLFTLCFYIVPGLANFHDPARFLIWTSLAFAVLAAVGMDALSARKRWFNRRVGQLTLLAILLPLWWFNRDWNPTVVPSALEAVPNGLDTIRAEADSERIASPGNTLFWRSVVNDGYIDYGNTDASAIAAISNTLLSNVEMRFGLESASGYEPVPIAGHVAIEGLTRLAQQRRNPDTGRLFALLNAHTLLMPREQSAPNIRFQFVNRKPELQNSPITLFDNRDSLPRAWMVRRVRRVEGKLRLAAAIADPEFDPGKYALVSGQAPIGSPDLEWGMGAGEEMPISPVNWTEEAPTHVRLSANAGSAPAFLIYSATAYPGWIAAIDGKPAALRRADGNFFGLPLPPGQHTIVLTYLPDDFRLGSYLSLAACGFISAVIGFWAVAHWKRGGLSAHHDA